MNYTKTFLNCSYFVEIILVAKIKSEFSL